MEMRGAVIRRGGIMLAGTEPRRARPGFGASRRRKGSETVIDGSDFEYTQMFRYPLLDYRQNRGRRSDTIGPNAGPLLHADGPIRSRSGSSCRACLRDGAVLRVS